MSMWDTLAKVTLIAGAIGLIVGYWNYAKPVFHGIEFEAGMCNYTNMTVDRDEKSCSCGKSCTGYYPCLQLHGTFMVNETGNNSQSDFNGTFYRDYAAVKKKCLMVPPCSRSFTVNSERVHNYLGEVLFPYVNNTEYPGPYNISTVLYNQSEALPCFGKDHMMYFEMNYALWKAIVSIAVPGTVFVVGILVTITCGSQDHKETVLSIIGLPFFVIAAIFVGISEILGLDGLFRGCYRKLRGCCRSCCRRPSPPSETPERSQRRRRSIELSAGALDMEMTVEEPRLRSRRNSLILTLGERLDDRTPDRRWSSSSLNTVGTQPDTFVPFYGAPNAPQPGHMAGPPYELEATAPGVPNYDPPPTYTTAAQGDSVMPPPPSYNDVMSGNRF